MGRYSRSRSRSKSYSRSRSRSRSPTYSYDDGYRIHVADLGIDPSKQDLVKIFEKFGRISDIWVARNPPCFAFIVYKYKEDADDAIKEMDGKTFSGGRIRVSYARPRTRGRKRRSFDPNLRCYQCGEKGHFSRDCDEIWRNRNRPRPKKRAFSRSHSRSRSRSRSRDRKSRRKSNRSRSRSRSRSKSKKDKKTRSRSRSGSHEKSRKSKKSSRRSSSREKRKSKSESEDTKEKAKERSKDVDEKKSGDSSDKDVDKEKSGGVTEDETGDAPEAKTGDVAEMDSAEEQKDVGENMDVAEEKTKDVEAQMRVVEEDVAAESIGDGVEERVETSPLNGEPADDVEAEGAEEAASKSPEAEQGADLGPEKTGDLVDSTATENTEQT